MIYASVCDGIGAVHCAWQPLGWRCAWTSEIAPFPAAVVDHHWGFPNLGDMTRITDEQVAAHGRLDLIVGGTPCQSFSVAGFRAGLADPRGNLALVYLGLVDRARPRWVVWENVPGVLSSGGGRDFGAFLGGLAELGYGWAYRVLDAQFVRVDSHARAVPQRRRRVFVVGYLGDWMRAGEVLFERGSMRGDPAPRREAGKGFAADVAPCLRGSGPGMGRTGDSRGQDPVVAIQERAGADRGGPGGSGVNTDVAAYTLEARTHVQAVCFQPRIGRNGRGYEEGVSPALTGGDAGATSDARPCVVHPAPQPFEIGNCLTRRMHKGINTTIDEGQTPILAFANTAGNTGLSVCRDHAPPITARKGDPGMVAGAELSVRRLMPVECERLQGFPDHYTAIEYRSKPAADSPRYQALGNSMAVNVMSWIGQRISEVDRLLT